MELERLIDGLSKPSPYDPAPTAVEVIQTHCSVVFLLGDDVYKIKKPVDLGFLDYSTLEKRRHFCEEEVRLNRRLAPDVYLGIVPIVATEQGLRVGGEGDAIEWAVRMRRLPEAATLAAWQRRGGLGSDVIGRAAQRVARFHASAMRNSQVSNLGRYEVVARNCRENFEQLRADSVGVNAHAYQWLRQMTEDHLRRGEELIEARAERGVPCETHGDLRLDHVYWFPERSPPDDLLIVDCIEFNERFRFADPVTDVAFLAMDLHRCGEWALARQFTEAYFLASGDEAGRALLPLYLAYRATVRAKVDAIRAGESEVAPAERANAEQSVAAHLLVALREVAPRAERPCLVLVGGLPGVGKSVLACHLNDAGFSWVRSDVVRKRLAGLEPTQSGKADFGEGLYTTEWSDRTYAACLEQTDALLREGRRVVVDATFIRALRRRPFIELARRLSVPVQIMLCDAPAELVKARLDARTGDPSDADWTTHLQARDRYEEPTDEEAPWVVIDASGAPHSMHEQAIQMLEQHHLA